MGKYWHTGKSFLLIALFVGIAYFGISQFVQHNTAFAYPKDPLERLMEGNQRFYNFHPVHPDEDISRLKKVQEGQHPIAVVICCSDSRLSPELIFDQGLGDLFVIRTAGNIIGGVELGSVEYAVEHLGVNLVMVMGHENCGAVKALVEGGEVHGHIQDIIDSLKQESEIRELVSREGYQLEHCIRANIIHGLKQITNQSALARDKVAIGQLKLIGTRFDLNSLKVDTISLNQ
jgi:carbonic anhydrase